MEIAEPIVVVVVARAVCCPYGIATCATWNYLFSVFSTCLFGRIKMRIIFGLEATFSLYVLVATVVACRLCCC